MQYTENPATFLSNSYLEGSEGKYELVNHVDNGHISFEWIGGDFENVDTDFEQDTNFFKLLTEKCEGFPLEEKPSGDYADEMLVTSDWNA